MVAPRHENEGIGRKLMNYVEMQAREKGFQVIFLLSTQAFNYFQQKGGFLEGTIDDLPRERRAKYELHKRNSKILKKSLAAPAAA